MNFDSLLAYGWSDYFAHAYEPFLNKADYLPGRISFQNQHLYRVYTAQGELLAEAAGKLRFDAASAADMPAVGDWVALRLRPQEDRARIQFVLPRRTKFVRKTVGAKTEAQIVGANVDTVFFVTSLNQDFNPRRIERYLTSVGESGAQPVIILSKADLCADAAALASFLAALHETAPTVPVHVISAKAQQGLAVLTAYCQTGKTLALVGTSGVGKSTLINALLGFEKQQVKAVRAHDDRGQHTTRHRELILLPQGGLVLDTPGMRELQLWEADAGIEAAFDDIEALAANCRFTDCRHAQEPHCAVRAALQQGQLSAERFANYRKMQSELELLAARQDDYARRQEQKKWRKLAAEGEARGKQKRKGSLS